MDPAVTPADRLREFIERASRAKVYAGYQVFMTPPEKKSLLLDVDILDAQSRQLNTAVTDMLHWRLPLCREPDAEPRLQR